MLLYGIFKKDFFDSLKKNREMNVFVLEGRPSLLSSRECCRELFKIGITPTIICDNMAGFLFARNLVKGVYLSSQASNDQGALCLVGGGILGVLAKRHHVPVSLFSSVKKLEYFGKSEDITFFNGIKVAPSNVKAYVPLVEWVSEKYITRKH